MGSVANPAEITPRQVANKSDKRALAETKHLVDVNSLPPDDEIAPEWDAFLTALDRPETQARVAKLFERDFKQSCFIFVGCPMSLQTIKTKYPEMVIQVHLARSDIYRVI